MPIYEYCCKNCGFSKDVLQKISDDSLTVCPSCTIPTFKKQITAAGFQLKGTGWYSTDFRGTPTPTTNSAEHSEDTASQTPKTASPKTDSGTDATASTKNHKVQ